MILRTIHVRAESIDEAARSVEAIIATDQQVAVYDMRTWSIIDEVLRIDGMEAADQVALLANHSRWSLDDVLGSVREIRTEPHQVRARLFFADGDDAAEKVWNKVRQRHIRDVSVGYQSLEYTDIPPGESRSVAGGNYKAGARTLRITTRWQLREVSAVLFGADEAAKIRAAHAGETTSTLSGPTPHSPQHQEVPGMDPAMRAFLQTIGLRAEATDAEAQTYYTGLSPVQREAADQHKTPSTLPADGQRTQPAAVNTAGQASSATPTSATPTIDVAAIRQQALTDERQRVSAIRAAAADVIPAELVERGINEGWD
ncbi:MAG: HK97 family phage prohead protease, partial [Acidobacteria bacterium]|nr:HK97 family phage prohead protease [Acidobacteriota bacterium]